MRLIAVSLILTLAAGAPADDWPQWRGVHRDAVLSPAEQVDSLPTGKIQPKWSVEIGGGYSGPTVADGYVYVMDRGAAERPGKSNDSLFRGRRRCARLGSFLRIEVHRWLHRRDPRASVTIDRGKAFAVGAMGHFHCLDAKSGEVLSAHDLEQEYDVRMPIWGITAAPLVYKDVVIQIVAGSGDACVVAFDIQSGKERWRSIDERGRVQFASVDQTRRARCGGLLDRRKHQRAESDDGRSLVARADAFE